MKKYDYSSKGIPPIIAVSGGFDPLHPGHVTMFKEAKEYGRVYVILNSDEWLVRKKGYAFMTYEQRKFLIESCRYVDAVISVDDSDGTVCDALEKLQPGAFANGGDRKLTNTPEVEICNKYEIELLWNIGGGKIESSSELIVKAAQKMKSQKMKLE